MVPISEELEAGQAERSDYFFNKVTYKDDLLPKQQLKVLNLLNHYSNSLEHVLDVEKLHI